MSGPVMPPVAQPGAVQEPERPQTTLDLLRAIVNEGPRVLSPLEARRVLGYIGDSERSRATLRMQVADAVRRARQAQNQFIAYREAAADREAELEQRVARGSWRLAEKRLDLPWGLLGEVDELYRSGASPDEWVSVMGRVGAALLGGGGR